MYNDNFMKKALFLAKKAYKKGEIPVGAVIIYKNRVIATGFNQKEKKHCCTKHAEIIAIEKASKKLKNWRLDDCDIYVTLEPCPMCASAIHQARISNIYYGAKSLNVNNEIITNMIYKDKNLNNVTNISGNFMEKECLCLLRDFFKKRREK